jgi:hypothetical protein
MTETDVGDRRRIFIHRDGDRDRKDVARSTQGKVTENVEETGDFFSY